MVLMPTAGKFLERLMESDFRRDVWKRAEDEAATELMEKRTALSRELSELLQTREAQVKDAAAVLVKANAGMKAAQRSVSLDAHEAYGRRTRTIGSRALISTGPASSSSASCWRQPRRGSMGFHC